MMKKIKLILLLNLSCALQAAPEYLPGISFLADEEFVNNQDLQEMALRKPDLSGSEGFMLILENKEQDQDQKKQDLKLRDIQESFKNLIAKMVAFFHRK